MKTVETTIQGTSALLINRFAEEAETPSSVSRGKKDYGSSRQQAEKTAYVCDKTNKLWIPSTWIVGAIRSVASDYKLSGTRKSVKSVSAGAIFPLEERLFFLEGYTLDQIEVDSRPVVIQRARIMRHRAKLEQWSLKCSFQIDTEILGADKVHEILSDSGKRSGIGDFRPSKGGPFGRFLISSWEVLKEAA